MIRLASDYANNVLPLTSRGSEPTFYDTSGIPSIRHSRWSHILAAMDAVIDDCVYTPSPILREAMAGWVLVGGGEGRPEDEDEDDGDGDGGGSGLELAGANSSTSRSGGSVNLGSTEENRTSSASIPRGQIVVSFWPRGSAMDQLYGHVPKH